MGWSPELCFGGAPLVIGHRGSVSRLASGAKVSFCKSFVSRCCQSSNLKKCLGCLHAYIPLTLTDSRHLTQCCEAVSQKLLNCRRVLVICVWFSLTPLSGSQPGLGHLSGSSCSPLSLLAKEPKESMQNWGMK